ncbi:Homeo [Glarea lozoyensis ATCC 20868]|uniref:Homeo n=1 Tax=Glarea lozoyensis (strain ATCC 20868 / MF5171) TaxID=1116229 RepID=S3DLQ2_GLAL2|nr:Homeo [Glarea lozoyensis ATCC 20868]EPE27468.1 Homeo [Glarea lozoyensis ATCC 20868]
MARTKRNWTLAEDTLLRTAVNTAQAQSRPLLWRELAKSVPGRSNKDCRRRWWNSLADGPAKGPWSENEDERLIEAVQKHGTNWSQVALAVGSRNSDQCLSHWNHVLDPSINHRDWTAQEDELLLHAVLSHGTNWTTISLSHPQKRTTLALKNRYSALRLRNENSKKAKDATRGKIVEASSGTDDSIMVTSNTDQGIEQKTPDMGQWDSRREADAEEEDENDEGWDEEDEGGVDDDRELSYVSPTPGSKEMSSGAPDTEMKDRSIASPESAINISTNNGSGMISPSSFHHDISNLCTETWMNGTSYLTPCESTYSFDHASLNVPSEYHENGAMQYRGTMNTSGDAMDFGHPLPEYNTVTKPMLGLPACNNTAEIEGGYSNAPKSMSTVSKNRQHTQDHAIPMYEVTVHAECTVTELEGLMVGLASTGTPYTVKMKPKPLKV